MIEIKTGSSIPVLRGFNGKTKRYFPKPRHPYIAPNPQGKDYFSNMSDFAPLSIFLNLTDIINLMSTCKTLYDAFSTNRYCEPVFSPQKTDAFFQSVAKHLRFGIRKPARFLEIVQRKLPNATDDCLESSSSESKH